MGKGEWEGDKYVGEWKDDKRNGQGTRTWAFGNYNWGTARKYVGEFKDSKRNGRGTLYFDDGEVYKGLWENNEFLPQY